MRLWSLHPEYLDRQGLTACWREGLLAQAVVAGRTRGYTKHAQLVRFRRLVDPLDAVGTYLVGVADEATRRGYRFDRTLIERPGEPQPVLTVTEGQVTYEWTHLVAKLAARSPQVLAALGDVVRPRVHPIFAVVPGPVEDWERLDPLD